MIMNFRYTHTEISSKYNEQVKPARASAAPEVFPPFGAASLVTAREANCPNGENQLNN